MCQTKLVFICVLYQLLCIVDVSVCCELTTFQENTLTLTQTVYDEKQITTVKFNGCITATPQFENVEEIKSKNGERIGVINRGAFANLKKLGFIFFQNNFIQKIEPGSFQNLSSIDVLAITINNITRIQEGVFNQVPSLDTLFLHFNNIHKIDVNAFDNLLQLETIYLTSNKIKCWNKRWLKHSKRLKYLYLNKNEIDFIPSRAFRKHPSLKEINLSQNKLRSIHLTAFYDLEYLTELDLSKNHLKSLPDKLFFSNDKLEGLYMVANNFSYLPLGIFSDMRHLTDLSINSNPMQCPCLYRIQNLARERKIQMELNYNDCIEPGNPVCVDLQPPSAVCVEEVHNEVLEKFYRNFEHPPVDCDSEDDVEFSYTPLSLWEEE